MVKLKRPSNELRQEIHMLWRHFSERIEIMMLKEGFPIPISFPIETYGFFSLEATNIIWKEIMNSFEGNTVPITPKKIWKCSPNIVYVIDGAYAGEIGWYDRDTSDEDAYVLLSSRVEGVSIEKDLLVTIPWLTYNVFKQLSALRKLKPRSLKNPSS